MARSRETYNKKEVRNKKEKKRKAKVEKRLARKENEKKSNFDDMIAYVDETGMITAEPPDPDKKSEIELDDIKISVAKQQPGDEMDPIRKGIVDYFNEAKGFGFIIDSETKESVFVHVNNVLEEIKKGNVVRFEVEMGQKGPSAVQVKLFK